MASRTAANGNGSRAGRNGKTKAVVLAGGRGTRLAPYTSVLPKPLMPVGERAILELVVDQLESCGIKDITFCVGYLAHLIQSVFDNRENGHVSIEYVHEQEALGTAGAAQARRRPRQHVPRDERRRADGARLPRPDPLPQGARQHAHDRDALAGDQGRLRDPPSRRHATSSRLRGEAGDHLSGEHGDLRHGARGARAHSREPVLRLSSPRGDDARCRPADRLVPLRRPLVRHRPPGGLRERRLGLGSGR